MGSLPLKYWVVVWNMVFFDFPYIGNNNPNWLIFFRWVETTNQNSLTNSIILQLFSFSVSRMTAQNHSTSIRFEGKTQDPWQNGLQNLMLPSKISVCPKVGYPNENEVLSSFPPSNLPYFGCKYLICRPKKNIRFLVTHHSKYPPSYPGRMGQISWIYALFHSPANFLLVKSLEAGKSGKNLAGLEGILSGWSLRFLARGRRR